MLELFRSPELRAVWLIQSRKLLSRLEFWLILIGYDRKTRSFSNWIYLIYVFIFFSFWIFAVLTLFANFAGQLLIALPFSSPLFAATAVGGLALTGFFLWELYFASRRSPFVFSEPDSLIICQTPVDRRFVGLIWFLSAWLIPGLISGAGGIVLGYACLEAQASGTLGVADLPRYFLAGLRMLVVIVPLHLAAQSSAWAVGALRLGKKDAPAALSWIAPILAVLLAAACLFLFFPSGELFRAIGRIITFPIQAGLGGAHLLPGLAAALLLSTLGLSLLWMAAKKMSLARAAQETRGQELLQTATLFGKSDLVRELKQRRRLGVEKVPARLPARPGMTAFLWKNAVQGIRSFTLELLFPWLGLVGLNLAIIQAPDLGMRVWLALFWIILLGGRATPALRGDLSRWWLLHQFPYASHQILLLDLGLPLVGIALTGIASLLLAIWLGIAIPPVAGWLFLPGAAGIALSAATDVLQQCRASSLLAGTVPGQSWLSILLGILLVSISGGIAWLLLAEWSFPIPVGIAIALAACLGLDYGLYRWAGSRLRRIG